MSKINFRGKEFDVPEGYEFVDVRIPKVGESFINYLGQFENRISDYDWTTGPRPILRKVEIKFMRLKTKPARETFTFKDLLDAQCPHQGLKFYEAVTQDEFRCASSFYEIVATSFAYQMLRKHNKPECWFRWFAEHIAPEPKPELKPIELKPISNDDDVAWTEIEHELSAIAYNAFLNIIYKGFWGDRHDTNMTLQNKIIGSFSAVLSKHGFYLKGW